MLDVWGSYKRGAGPLVELSVALRLYEPRVGAFVSFAASARPALCKGRLAVEAYHDTAVQLSDAVRASGQYASRPVAQPATLTYGTMHVHGQIVEPR